MPSDKPTIDYKMLGAYIHKCMGIELNGLVWTLLEKEDRNQDDEYRLINAAYASLYHWSEVGKPENLQRGEWLVSHVYAILGMADFALYHAKKCIEITTENDIVDFDLAFANEAMARAYAASQNKDEYNYWYKLAKEAGEKISDTQDKEIFQQTLSDCKL